MTYDIWLASYDYRYEWLSDSRFQFYFTDFFSPFTKLFNIRYLFTPRQYERFSFLSQVVLSVPQAGPPLLPGTRPEVATSGTRPGSPGPPPDSTAEIRDRESADHREISDLWSGRRVQSRSLFCCDRVFGSPPWSQISGLQLWSLTLTRELTWCPCIPTRRTPSSPTKSVRGHNDFGLEERGGLIDQINGSGLMEADLILPNFVPESRTTSLEIKTVSTLAGPFCSISAQEKPGMISPVIIGYLLFARN